MENSVRRLLDAIGISGGARVVDIPMDRIEPSRYQPRIHFDEQALRELAVSIQENGLIHFLLSRLSAAFRTLCKDNLDLISPSQFKNKLILFNAKYFVNRYTLLNHLRQKRHSFRLLQVHTKYSASYMQYRIFRTHSCLCLCISVFRLCSRKETLQQGMQAIRQLHQTVWEEQVS